MSPRATRPRLCSKQGPVVVFRLPYWSSRPGQVKKSLRSFPGSRKLSSHSSASSSHRRLLLSPLFTAATVLPLRVFRNLGSENFGCFCWRLKVSCLISCLLLPCSWSLLGPWSRVGKYVRLLAWRVGSRIDCDLPLGRHDENFRHQFRDLSGPKTNIP